MEDLKNKWSIVERKSLILQPPSVELSKCEFYSFFAGYVDGDGSVYEEPSGYCRLSLVGTKPLLEWIYSNIGFKGSISKDRNIHKLRYSGKTAEKIIQKVIGINISPLKRKWLTFGDVVV